jgi:hypothetical protein
MKMFRELAGVRIGTEGHVGWNDPKQTLRPSRSQIN